MLIWLIRHGETDWNADMRYQGRMDIPLGEAGRKALRRADFSPKKVYVTSLARTAQTAEILFPDAEQEVAEGLEEMSFGDFEGRNYIEMEHDPDYRAWVDGGCVGKCPNGESRAEFEDRVVEAFARLMDLVRGRGEKELVLVGHGGTQMALLERCGEPPRSYHDWLTANGQGYLLDGSEWDARRVLKVAGRLNYTEEACGSYSLPV